MNVSEILGPLGLIEDILNNIGFYIRFALIIVLIFHIQDIHALIKYFSLRKKVQNNILRWEEGRIDLDDLCDLSPRQFEFWCGEFITKLGYTNMQQSSMGPDGGVDIVCNLQGYTVYVQCKRYLHGKNPKYVVDSKVCENLVGAMKAKVCHDSFHQDKEITKGMIITTGTITNDALQYIKTLPAEYSIELIDGNDMLERYSFLYKYKLRIVS